MKNFALFVPQKKGGGMENKMKIALSGYGKMGKMVESVVATKENIEIAGIKDTAEGCSSTFEEIKEDFDVIVDFSHPDFLDDVLAYGTANNKALVIATTAHSDEQKKKIEEAAKKVPIVYSANFSLGINIMEKVLRDITPILKDSFDMEMIEKHHNQKLDSPSGTAKMLVRAMNPDGEFEEVYGREGMSKRGKEIGIHAIRGGTIPGEHTALFAGDDELFEIKHNANSRKIFAVGALTAAQFAVGADAGLYSMSDVLFGK